MRKIHTQSHSPRHEGGPARKLAAATRAVMEPVEHRLMMSITPATEQIAAITAKFETTPVVNGPDAADDPAVWINPTDASLSTILGTDKVGALNVYDLNGSLIQSITGAGYNNVDVRGNLVAASNLGSNSITLFSVDPATRQLTNVSARTIRTTTGGDIYGLTMYTSADTGKNYVFVTNKDGALEQFELSATSNGKVDATSVRKFNVGSTAEGMVADDESGALYVSEEDVGVWKYGAEPTDGAVRTRVDTVGFGGHLAADVEGLAIYKTANGAGYLIASSQGSNDYVVYDRQTGEYVTRFGVTGVTGSEGIEVTNANLGASLSEGAFIAHERDTTGESKNFKVVSWGDIARAQAIPLVIDGAQNPTQVTNPAPSPTVSPVTGLALIDNATGQVLANLTNGATIDLAKYSGKKLNIKALIEGSQGSIEFAQNGRRITTENFVPYVIGGEDANWTPSAGEHTITATPFAERYGLGQEGAVYSVKVKFVNSPSPVVLPETPDDAPASGAPSKPSNVSASTSDDGAITVRWSAVNSATGYKISRSTDGGKTFNQIATVSGGSTSYKNSGLNDGAVYTYKVAAYNTVGTSALSNAVSATTDEDSGSDPVAELPRIDPNAPKGQPSASNTGAKGTLTTVSNFLPESGKTYQNLRITGMIDLRNISNVTFINCVVDANGHAYAFRADGSGTNRVFKNVEMKNMASAAVYGANFQAINSYVHHSGNDGFKPTENVLLQGNYVTMLGYNNPTSHADGVQIREANNVRVVGNFFDMARNVANTKSNAALMLQLDVRNITFEGNWCKGGNFTIQAIPDSGGSTIRIVGNIFYAGSPQFGFGRLGDGVVWQNNTVTSGGTASASQQ